MPLRRVLAVLALLAWSLVVVAADAVGGTPTAPRRIVSLNLCTDQLVLALADRDAVRSVTWLARDPQSAVMAAAAADVPVNHGLAEEIIPFAPDLVVAGIYTTRTTVALLKRFGLPVLELDVPQSLPAIAAQIRTVAHALGHPERGEAMVTAMMADLTALGPIPAGPWPVAVVYHPNGFTGGRGSLIDDLLTRAGLRNLAAELALTHYGRLSLDLLLLGQPDLLILNTRDDLTPSLTHQVLRHPGLAKAFPHMHTLVIPPRLWSCAGPWVVETIAQLRTAQALDGLTLGEDTARSLGVRLGRLQLQLVVGTALAVGSAVAVTGTIGFVGLVVPHLLRPLVGYQPSQLLLTSALGGAALILAADIAVRLLAVGPELKLGVVTALLGAPFFLALLHRLRRETL